MSLAPVAVVAIGNPSRGDDALGPLLLERLVSWLQEEGRADVELIEDFQLQVEHALDLQGRRLVLFVDAGSETPAPFHFYRLEAASDFGHTTHALSPGAVLQVYRQTLGEPPPAFVLCIRGESFGLGAPPTALAVEHLEAACAQVRQLLAKPEPAAWLAAASG